MSGYNAERVLTSTAPLSWPRFQADLHSENAAEEWRGSWAIAMLYRRPGIYVAWWAAHAGIRPATITLSALFLALLMPLQAILFPIGLASIMVCVSGMLFQILDCADGALARATDQPSQRGGDMDFLTDMAQWGLLYAAIGILTDRTLDTGLVWTCLALAAAWCRLMARIVRDRLNDPSVSNPPSQTKTSPLSIAAFVLGGISGLLPLLALSGPCLGWAVGFLLVYALSDIAEGLVPIFKS